MSAALEVADVFRRHGDAYRRDHAGHLGRVERRVMAPSSCAGRRRWAAMSSTAPTAAWSASPTTPAATGTARSARARPAPNGWPRARPSCCRCRTSMSSSPCRRRSPRSPSRTRPMVYAILFRAAAETLRTIAADPKHLGAEIGLVAVLHTWGQNLHHHPHVHCVVPGGGPSLDGTRWVACRPGFFLPVRVLSRLFRRLFLDELQAAFEAGELGFFGELAGLAEPAAFARRLRAAAPGRLGRLRQAAVRRPRTGAGLSRPLYPSRRHRQQPPGQPDRRPRSPSAGRTIATTARRSS